MEYIAVLNNYLEYNFDDDSHTVNLSFQSTSMHIFHAAVSILVHSLNLTDWNLD